MATNLAIDGNITVGGTSTVTGAQALSGNVAIGTTAANTLGFYGFTPVVQPTATAQSAINTTVITTVSSTSLTTLDLTKINALIARVEEIRVYVTQTRTDLIALGLQKGS